TEDDGIFEWTIPDDPSTNCLVKITDTDGGDPSDSSDAVFTISQLGYTLTMAIDPTEGGSTEPAVGGHTYSEGTVVDINATPNEGYGFINWTGDAADRNSATTTVTMDNDKTVTANFALIPDRIIDLRASVQGDNILLEWSPSPNATSYQVYRDTSYDFVADKVTFTNRIAESINDEDPNTDGVQWTDTGNGVQIVGDVNINYFYRVTAFSEVESDTSNLVGEFDYQLITTSSTDINEIVVIMKTKNSRTPILTAEDLANAIPYCSDVYYWDAEGQGTVGHPKGVPFNNFSIYAGYPYIVNVTSNTVWTVAGTYSDTSFQLIVTYGTDINHIGVPLSKDSLTAAEKLGQDIPNCSDVYYWDAEGQGTVGHVVGLPFENFVVRAGYPYYVNVTSATVWPASDGQSQLNSIIAINDMTKNNPNSGAGRGVAHTVYGKLSYPAGLNQAGSELTVRAWIISRAKEILTHDRMGSGCDGQYWWIGVSDFATAWQVGDSLQVEISDKTGKFQGVTIVVLTDAGSDNGGEILLAEATSVITGNSLKLTGQFMLHQNYPNPFNPETLISFQLPEARNVSLKVYNVLGAEICTLLNEKKGGGQHQVIWNGKDNLGQETPSGVYFIKIVAGDYRMIRKMIKIR
ncbi:MAG: T9SS type A sorting domain-containing protein, partial [bacterium]